MRIFRTLRRVPEFQNLPAAKRYALWSRARYELRTDYVFWLWQAGLGALFGVIALEFLLPYDSRLALLLGVPTVALAYFLANIRICQSILRTLAEREDIATKPKLPKSDL